MAKKCKNHRFAVNLRNCPSGASGAIFEESVFPRIFPNAFFRPCKGQKKSQIHQFALKVANCPKGSQEIFEESAFAPLREPNSFMF